MFQVDKYKAYSWGFPSHSVPPEEKKKKDYCLAFAKAFYSYWLRDEFVTTYNVRRDEIFVLRHYGKGDQAEDMYMDWCYGKNSAAGALRKGYMNVNFEIVKEALRYRNTFLGMFSGVEFEISCDALDVTSKTEKEEKFIAAYVNKKMRPILAQQGIDVPQPDTPEPDSMSELALYQQLGVYKNQFEMAAEKFIKESFSTFSNWELEVKRMVLEDWWDAGEACVKDCLDHQTQKIKVEYCDIANLIIRKDNEGRILDGGVIKIKTIADVRTECALCGYEISEDELMQASIPFQGFFGNPRTWFEGRDAELYKPDAFGRYIYDNWKIAVLDCEYRSSDTSFFTEKEKNGKKTYYTEEYGKEYKNSKSKKIIRKSKIVYYRGKWILGTDHIYDYGQQYDIPRPDKSEAMSSFHYCKLPGFSPVKTIKPVLDQMQMIWLKYQNNVARATPPINVYEENVIKNTTIGSKMTPDEVIRMAEQSGRMFYKALDKWNDKSMTPNSTPIFQLPGGMGTAMKEFINGWTMHQTQIQNLLGFAPQAVAQPVSPDIGKAVTETAINATTNIIKPIINEYERLKRDVAKTMLLRGMLTFQFSDEISKDYYDVLGEETVEILKMCSKSADQLGINTVPTTTGELRIKLENAANTALAAQQITLPEFNILIMLLDGPASAKYINILMTSMITARQAQEQANKQALIKEQADGNDRSAMVATEGAKELAITESNEKMKQRAFDAAMTVIENKSSMEGQIEINSAESLIQTLLQNYSTPAQSNQPPTTP